MQLFKSHINPIQTTGYQESSHRQSGYFPVTVKHPDKVTFDVAVLHDLEPRHGNAEQQQVDGDTRAPQFSMSIL